MTNDIRAILSPSDVAVAVPARCQRDVLARLAAHAAGSFRLDEAEVLDTLTERERLGSTSIGHGVAIPHGKAAVSGVRGVLFALKEPVDFEAVDDEPVDLAFLLLAPEGDDAGHLKALSRVARRLRSEGVRSALRGARSKEALYAVLTGEADAEAA
jgi:PTS system nitrogen regulatory IIA component